jgi:hypothetical protein
MYAILTERNLLRLHIKYSLQFYDNDIDNFVRIALHVTTLYVNKSSPIIFQKSKKQINMPIIGFMPKNGS